jgi:multimeric flavodoxin WrbA
MNVLVLNGAPGDGRGELCRRITGAAANAARRNGAAVTVFDLDAMAIKPCRGCFACWLKHPGICAVKDDEEPILRAAAATDVHIWTTPVVFGGYGQALKKALDRLIPNILPFFMNVRGEVHHPPRYERRQSLIVLGTLPAPDAEAERIFRDLVGRNSINLHSTMTRSRVIYEATEDPDVERQVEELINAAAGTR